MPHPASSSSEEESSPKTGGLEVLSGGSARDLRTLQVKLTHVGAQSKSVPSVVFSTFYQIARMDWFVPLRRPNLHYRNDETALWSFTVTPEEMEHVVKSLHQRVPQRDTLENGGPYLSLMLVLRDSRLGQHDYEAVFSRAQGVDVMQAITDALDADNGVGRKVMALRHEIAA